MRLPKKLAWFTLSAALALPGASSLMAQDWRYRDTYHDRQDVHRDYRDLGHDYNNVDRMRADIARDRFRLNQDIRSGNSYAAAGDARDLARDQQALNAQFRDAQHDRGDIYRDRNDNRRDHWYRGY